MARAGEAAFLRAVDGVSADVRGEATAALEKPREAARQLVTTAD